MSQTGQNSEHILIFETCLDVYLKKRVLEVWGRVAQFFTFLTVPDF